MKLLLDTNILIPLEPSDQKDVSSNSERASAVARLAQEGGHSLYRHPLSRVDLDRDANTERASMVMMRVQKYPALPNPPSIPTRLAAIIGNAKQGSNDWVDDHLLAALEADAVDLLITEDRGIRSKARALSLIDRVLNIAEALSALGRPPVVAPRAVVFTKAYAIQPDDPILQSFRDDYSTFDKWFSKCRRQHRDTWVIDGVGDHKAAMLIVNPETETICEAGHKVLKLCSLKVGEGYNGFKYGELLLKAVFDYAYQRRYTGLYITAFDKHESLLELLGEFGFMVLPERTSIGELRLVKRLEPPSGDSLAGLEFSVAYGPPRFDPERPWHLVPIRPEYSDVLFPESAEHGSLFDGLHSFGNAIRKAYLCNSPSRQVSQGDVLAFYRTRQVQSLIAIGVVERSIVSSDASEVMRAVAKRTVYSQAEIERICEREALVLLFRQVMLVHPLKRAAELLQAGVFVRAPQSIMMIGEGGVAWLKEQFRR